MTDERSWKRGVDYFDNGAVYSLLEDRDVLHAKVRGRHNYRVQLRLVDGEWDWDCSCPMGDAGVFCKHCVAVGLACIDAGVNIADQGAGKNKSTRRRSGQGQRAVTLDDVRRFLVQQKGETLVEIIIQQVLEDDRLRESLLMRVARQRPEGLDVATFRNAIDSATDTGGFVDYSAAYGFARGIDEVVDSIAQLLDEGHPDAVIELSERALERCEEALGMMDDSDGEMGGLLERLQEVHHAACKAAKPDPEELARRLFDWEMQTDWDTFFGAAERYADVLGAKGLAVYRGLAQSEWKRVPVLGPADERRSFEGSRFRLTSIMESLARANGDVESLVAIKRRDLSSPYKYLQIAQIYKEVGESDKAMRWAEDGIKAFPNRPDERLRDFLADEYHRRQRHDDAMALIWASFVERPYLRHYQELKQHATRAKAWRAWREKALANIRETIRETRQESRKRRTFGVMEADHSTLVEIYLWEKDTDTAWKEARAGGCSEHLWMQLAKLREAKHPADALDVYLRQIEPIIDRKNKDAYREAVALIRKIGQLMKRVGRGKEFPGYVASIRDAHSRKRNLLTLLDRMKAK